MTQTLRKLVTLDEFVAKYPDNSGKRYELHDAVVVEMSQPTGEHEEVVGFLALNISLEIGRLKLPYFIPKTALVKPLESYRTYAKHHELAVIHELPLRKNQGFIHILRKS